ncbi:SGNH/GDSL hydrolase family protein [Aquiflexum sp.]|uniref:SGNH/GDSL hydrolase family protein n=1 Tax=Aquiflexum sp. TaxID=1872584 RepID=UPI0035932837
MQKLLLSTTIWIILSSFPTSISFIADEGNPRYLNPIIQELEKEWPNNRPINFVFPGHSVPAGYQVTPEIRTLEAYPHLLLKKIKQDYPQAHLNIIVTAIGGENSLSGSTRFGEDVLSHQPDLIFIDYALNDRNIGLEESQRAWGNMIKAALATEIKVILLTPTPDLNEDISDEKSPLNLHAEMIRKLAKEYKVGIADSYDLFKQLSKSHKLEKYMAQKNHINDKGHELVSNLLYEYFNPNNHE